VCILTLLQVLVQPRIGVVGEIAKVLIEGYAPACKQQARMQNDES
jgi:hypothetical protein